MVEIDQYVHRIGYHVHVLNDVLKVHANGHFDAKQLEKARVGVIGEKKNRSIQQLWDSKEKVDESCVKDHFVATSFGLVYFGLFFACFLRYERVEFQHESHL